MKTKDQYVLLDDVNDLIKLYSEREIFADYARVYEQLTEEINAKIVSIRSNVEEF